MPDFPPSGERSTTPGTTLPRPAADASMTVRGRAKTIRQPRRKPLLRHRVKVIRGDGYVAVTSEIVWNKLDASDLE